MTARAKGGQGRLYLAEARALEHRAARRAVPGGWAFLLRPVGGWAGVSPAWSVIRQALRTHCAPTWGGHGLWW